MIQLEKKDIAYTPHPDDIEDIRVKRNQRNDICIYIYHRNGENLRKHQLTRGFDQCLDAVDSLEAERKIIRHYV